jgi:hypothetical protein
MNGNAYPRLVAAFETDEEGSPAFLESDGRRNYKIALEVENAPEDAYAATFELDSSYFDPRRTLQPDSDGKFRLQTTSNHNFDVTVRLRTKRGELPMINNLASALQESQKQTEFNPSVHEAIDYIISSPRGY